MTMTKQQIVVCPMGRLPYEDAWVLQRRLQSRLVRAKRLSPPQPIPHLLLLVEHPPVYTLGKSGDPSNLLVDEATLDEQGATFVHIDRGGDITYHGPGQLVGYPILDLDRFYTDIHRYLRELEEVIIRSCASFDLAAKRIPGLTGVWIEVDKQTLERKIAAMGIRCSRWVTMHGFAFNINTELRRYEAIVPCGISDRAVTSLAAELGRDIDEEEVQTRVVHHFGEIFAAEIEHLEQSSAMPYIEAYLADREVIG